MSLRRYQPNVRLPQSLLEEISAKENGPGRHGNLRGGVQNRKAQRKAERQQAKQRKAEHFSSNHNDLKRRADAEVDRLHSEGNKKRRLSTDNSETIFQRAVSKVDAAKSSSKSIKEPTEATKAKERKEGPDVKGKAKAEDIFFAKPARSMQDIEEDAYISMLEKKLGINKKKKGKDRYNTAFEDDGLLDLLVGLDEKALGDENGLDAMLNTAESEGSGFEEYEAGESEEDEEDEGEDEDENEEDAAEEEGQKVEDEGEENNQWTGFASDELDSRTEEPIRKRNFDSPKMTTSYVPPHLRKPPGVAEADVKLMRTLKGLLNRLSEQNIDSILKEIENLYRSHRRHDITSTLTNLIIKGTCSHSILLDSYVALHAGLVACLYKIMGIELAAYFVQSVVAQFEEHYQKALQTAEENQQSRTEDEPLGKECSNLLTLLSDLYSYRVISCTLVYDIIRLILEGELQELDVELILKLARGSGSQLRQDDPSALKDINQILQSKLEGQGTTNSRTRFMVETLTNLKNNKVKKQASQGRNESKERITKFVNGIDKKYHVHTHEPLRISLEDLHNADTKGKWWLVGAAWGGDPLVDRQEGPETQVSAPDEMENTLLKLARKQGMNTDVRRSIFVVLMSSDDYVDACDRLSQLNLTDVQQREIIRVLLHCCGNEKVYNPYYTLIGQHLCHLSHNHKITLQYCLWDFLKSLGESGVGGAEMAKGFENDENMGFDLSRVSSTRVTNVAKAYAWWIAKDSVAITIMKTIDFVTLKPRTQSFLKQLFMELFVSTQNTSAVPNMNANVAITRRDSKPLEDVMLKALRFPVLARGVLHFITTVLKKVDVEDEDMKLFLEWAANVAKETLQMGLEAGARVD